MYTHVSFILRYADYKMRRITVAETKSQNELRRPTIVHDASASAHRNNPTSNACRKCLEQTKNVDS